jgi:hypothetical protein
MRSQGVQQAAYLVGLQQLRIEVLLQTPNVYWSIGSGMQRVSRAENIQEMRRSRRKVTLLDIELAKREFQQWEATMSENRPCPREWLDDLRRLVRDFGIAPNMSVYGFSDVEIERFVEYGVLDLGPLADDEGDEWTYTVTQHALAELARLEGESK